MLTEWVFYYINIFKGFFILNIMPAFSQIKETTTCWNRLYGRMLTHGRFRRAFGELDFIRYLRSGPLDGCPDETTAGEYVSEMIRHHYITKDERGLLRLVRKV